MNPRLAFLAFLLLLPWADAARAGDRPNILWITSEDNSPYLGCYGDPLAQTPHLDRLAAQGIRYRNAFANAPVCSAARSTLITGLHASSLGIHNHRSRVAIPSSFALYPATLRAAGYYCSNNSKTDYNLTGNSAAVWDESGNRAHYRNRKTGQPFFAVFNLTVSHEGQVQDSAFLPRRRQGLVPPTTRVRPDQIMLPPYHPDTPAIREDWARYYDNMTLMDIEAGRLLADLETAGLAEDTIVFYYADHGGALPRGKRNLHDSGTRVPLILRFPAKWSNLAPAKPGEWVEQPVSFVDFPATLCSLAGVPIPAQYEGRAFLGPQAGPPQDHVFLFRGRMDERYDTARAIRTRRYRYVRNYTPHRPWGQHYFYPFEVLPSMQSWFDTFQAGQCDPIQARYWQSKPAEELYDLQTDPFEVLNLADDPAHASLLADLRRTLRADLLRWRDTGFIPEGMFERLAKDRTVFDFAQSEDYPLERVLETADLASSGDPAGLSALITALADPDPIVRYWAATGCLVLQTRAAAAREPLTRLLQDESPDVRVVAAEALAHLDRADVAVPTLRSLLSSPNEYQVLAALNALDALVESGRISRDQAKDACSGIEFDATANRIAVRFSVATGAAGKGRSNPAAAAPPNA